MPFNEYYIGRLDTLWAFATACRRCPGDRLFYGLARGEAFHLAYELRPAHRSRVIGGACGLAFGFGQFFPVAEIAVLVYDDRLLRGERRD